MAKDFYKRPTIPPEVASSETFRKEEIPDQIGPYKIESLLEKGGMSVLYLGLRRETNEPTTIKALSPRYVSHPEMIQRFLREAEIIALTDHPHIVKLYGHGEWEGGLYIAMEFIPGMSLRQYLLQYPISLRKALEMTLDIAYALCHLHAHGIIHRDLKPENILIAYTGQVKVIDFGIAHLLTDPDSQQAKNKKRLIGTPIYMSPEQQENPEIVSYPSDIYSLGIITYELILGKLSHGHIHLSLMPKGLQKTLAKMLQPEPKDRYQDIVDFIADISLYLNSPLLAREQKASDFASDFLEQLSKGAKFLLPDQFPLDWRGVEGGVAVRKGVAPAAAFQDFYALPNGLYGCAIGASSLPLGEGVSYTAMTRGIVRALYQLTTRPQALAAVLNDLLKEERKDPAFIFNYLILHPAENQLYYLACGESRLWRKPANSSVFSRLPSSHPPLGASSSLFQETILPWEENDQLLFIHSSLTNEEEKILSYLSEETAHAPQKRAENLLRKCKTSDSLSGYYLSLVLLLKTSTTLSSPFSEKKNPLDK